MKNINYIWTKNFNSHAHVERDCGKEHTTSDTPNFNSHAHVERDAERADKKITAQAFQLTRSRGA